MAAASIDILLDQHARLPGDGDGTRLLAATQDLLAEAARLEIDVRMVDGLEPAGEPRILVAADRVVRAQAADRGWTPVPHPALALPVALGEALAFARLSGDLGAIGAVAGVVPYWVEQRDDGSAWSLAALPQASLAAAIDAGLGVQRLPLDVSLQDPLFVQLDEGAQVGDALDGYEILWSDASRVLVALAAGQPNDEIPLHGAHGHFRFLTPSPELLHPARVVAMASATTRAAGPQAAPAPVTAESFLADIARYAGLAPLDARGTVRSRHSSHPDNARAVSALLADLTELGYAPATHDFSFGGRVLRNVIADLPGSGELGADAGLVVLGCHLDSTAARDPGYLPASSPARGADDDGSGLAALLAIARHMKSLDEPPHNTIRFGFFNAEESGLVGSRAYAASLKAAGAPVMAVVCADMIGYNSDAARTWELHAGFTDARVRDLSVPLAQLVADAAEQLGELPPAQLYSGTTATGGTDPTRFDGAINRSDHASFQEQGYPAVLVSEDFFPNRPAEPAADPNPNYHSNADIEVDGEYAAQITRAMSVAVLELAARPGILVA